MAQGEKRTKSAKAKDTESVKAETAKAKATGSGKKSAGKGSKQKAAASSAESSAKTARKTGKSAAREAGKTSKTTQAKKSTKSAGSTVASPKVSHEEAKPLSRTLVDLHLEHELSRLRGERFIQELRSEVSAYLDMMGGKVLNEWVTPDQIMGVIRRNVVELKIAGGVAELAGDMASEVFSSKAHRETRLKEIMTGRQFEEFVEKLLSLKSHRQRVVSQLLGHPVYSELVSKILYQGIVQYLSKSNLSGSNIPGVSAVFKFGKKMVDKAAPDLEANLESSLRGFIGKNMGFFIRQSEVFLNETLSDHALKGTIMDFWDAIENKPMKDFQKGIDTLDLSEFVVLGYEFWLKYRKTKHFENACRTVVDAFFDKYGDQPLSVLLEDMGVTHAMILMEAEAFAPRIAEVLLESGYLEERLRLRLESFYYSETVQKLL